VYGYVATSIGPVLPRLSSEFALTPAFAGALMSLSSIGGLLSVLGGWVSDRIGRVLVGAISMATSALGALVLGLAPNIYALGLSLVVMGTSAGFLESAMNAFASDLYPEKRGLSVNLLHIGWNVGSALGPSLAALTIVATNSWRNAYLFPLPALIFISASLVRLNRNTPKAKGPNTRSHASVLISAKSASKFLPIALTGFFYVASEMGINTWLAFILEDLGSQVFEAGLTIGLFWGLMGLSRLIWAPATDKIGYEKSIIAASGSALVCMIAATLPWSLTSRMMLWMLSGFFFGPIFPTLVAWGTSTNPDAGATLSGLIFTLGTLGLFVSNSLTGLVLALLGSGAAQYVFVFFAAAMLMNVLIIRALHK